MFDVFSDIFARRDNALTRIDPRAKLVAAVSVIILVILSDNMLMPSGNGTCLPRNYAGPSAYLLC
jgi:hypothetical protein